MTHPTIEAVLDAICEYQGPMVGSPERLADPDWVARQEKIRRSGNEAQAKIVARVILSAPPSEAEVEAACAAGYGKAWAKFAKGIQGAAIKNMRAALTAAYAKRLEELEGK